MIALIIGGAVAAAAVIALVGFALAKARQRNEAVLDGDLDALGRSLLRRVRQERDALAELSNGMSDSVLAVEALAEANSLYDQSARAAQKRAELRALARAKAKSDFEASGLESKLAAASPAEKPALEEALRAKRSEAEEYGKADRAISGIEAKMHQAAAAIGEVRAQLAVRQGALDQANYESDELSGLVARLRTMSQSYQEAQEYLNQQ